VEPNGTNHPEEEHEHTRRGWRQWGRAVALGLAGLVAGGVLAATLTAGAAETTDTTGSGATTGSSTQSGSADRQGQPCPEDGSRDGGGAPSEGTSQY
jgi:hypothetical protein